MPTTSPATLLIADCGATSGKWALVDRATGCVRRFVTGPVNPAVYNPSHIAATLAEASGRLPMPPDAVAIYAAGAIGPGAQMLAREAAAAFGLRIEAVSVDTDLAGAATALFGTERGVACILGTGSNTCLWSGSSIERNMRPMGYILGDEGSGAALGASMLRMALRHRLDSPLAAAWAAAYPDLDYPSVVEAVYRRHEGSGYIASFVPFVAAHKDHPAIAAMIAATFRRFVEELSASYPEARELPVRFTGGVAHAFGQELKEVAASYGIMVDMIVRDPLDMLVGRLLGRL